LEPACVKLAISCYNAQINEAYELALRFRAKSIPVVLGGTHITTLPHEAHKYGSTLILGEGEPVWLDVLNDA
jgi:radical SAM superfamily enzyme YgiQ (UPF0313 family)